MEELWPAVTAIAGVVTAITIVVTAVVSFLHYRSSTRSTLPLLQISMKPPRAGVMAYMVRFETKSEWTQAGWLVNGVRLKHNCLRRHLSEPGEGWGGDPPIAYHAKAWHRRVRFDPAAKRGIFLLHPDAPDPFELCFTMCTTSSPRTRATIRIRARSKA